MDAILRLLALDQVPKGGPKHGHHQAGMQDEENETDEPIGCVLEFIRLNLFLQVLLFGFPVFLYRARQRLLNDSIVQAKTSAAQLIQDLYRVVVQTILLVT